MKNSVAVFMICALCAGCMIVPKPTLEELKALNAPPEAINSKIAKFLPRVMSWYGKVESDFLAKGRALTREEVQQARALGVMYPEQVRVVVLDNFPLPSDPELQAEAMRYGLGSRAEGGRTMGYLIMLKPWIEGNQTVLTHELVHVSQHDRMGREAFLRRYLVEMEMMGYARSPLELEAYQKQSSTQ